MALFFLFPFCAHTIEPQTSLSLSRTPIYIANKTLSTQVQDINSIPFSPISIIIFLSGDDTYTRDYFDGKVFFFIKGLFATHPVQFHRKNIEIEKNPMFQTKPKGL